MKVLTFASLRQMALAVFPGADAPYFRVGVTSVGRRHMALVLTTSPFGGRCTPSQSGCSTGLWTPDVCVFCTETTNFHLGLRYDV